MEGYFGHTKEKAAESQLKWLKRTTEDLGFAKPESPNWEFRLIEEVQREISNIKKKVGRASAKEKA